jgi:hypothetical protein
MPIARFGYLPPAIGICRVKVVPVVGINVTPCNTIEWLFGQEDKFRRFAASVRTP